MMEKKLISLVIPVYNEQEVLPQTFARVKALADSLAQRYDFEFVFTDNHSTDNTFALLTAFSSQDRRVRALRFSKNFGYQRSILTGYLAASGDAVVQLDADLEDPPELIAKFLDEWEGGFDVVYGVRLSRHESAFKTLLRKVFYRLIDKLSEDRLPHDAGDFRLVDRKVVAALKNLNDATPYLRGIIAGLGFNQKGIEYHRDKRQAGKSKFDLASNLGLATAGILNHSTLPLRMASYLGLMLMFASALVSLGYFVLWLFNRDTLPSGFTTIVILLLFGIGLNSMFLGIIGEYVGSIHKQVKAGPTTVIEKSAGLGEEALAELARNLCRKQG